MKEVLEFLVREMLMKYIEIQMKEKDKQIQRIQRLSEENNLNTVIEEFFSNKNKHRYCISKDRERKYCKRFIDEIKKFDLEDFDKIIQKVSSTVNDLKREENDSSKSQPHLMIYDLALTIGVFYGKLPEKVYIHAGVQWGIDKLSKIYDKIDDGANSKKFREGKVEVAMLKCNYDKLKPYHLENFLCHYKDDLGMVVSVFKIEEDNTLSSDISKLIEETCMLLKDKQLEEKFIIVDIVEKYKITEPNFLKKNFYNGNSKHLDVIKKSMVNNRKDSFYNTCMIKIKEYIAFYIFIELRKKNDNLAKDINEYSNEFEYFLEYFKEN